MADTNSLEVLIQALKRLPGVTIGGAPGRGGAIRMRGLGGGYTQILLDGERVPPGFSIDSLTPEQVEQVEGDPAVTGVERNVVLPLSATGATSLGAAASGAMQVLFARNPVKIGRAHV